MRQQQEIQDIFSRARTYVGYTDHDYIGELEELTAAIVQEAGRCERESDDPILIAKAVAYLHRPFPSSNASKVMKVAAELLSDLCLDDELRLLLGATLFLACHEPLRCLEKIEHYYKLLEVVEDIAGEYDW